MDLRPTREVDQTQGEDQEDEKKADLDVDHEVHPVKIHCLNCSCRFKKI